MRNILFLLLLTLPVSIALAQDIFAAARTGDLKRMEELIRMNPDTINSVNTNGFTPLVIAGYRNQTDAVEFLLKHQADINASSPEGPVILGACYKGNLELTRMLIRYKANVNATNDLGTTALMYAVLSGNNDLVKLLLASGAKKEPAEKSGKTALSYAKMQESKEIIALLSDEK